MTNDYAYHVYARLADGGTVQTAINFPILGEAMRYVSHFPNSEDFMLYAWSESEGIMFRLGTFQHLNADPGDSLWDALGD